MAAAQEKAEVDPRIDEARRRFHELRRERVRTHGPETWDEAEVLYVCEACGKATVVRDAFYGREVTGPVNVFLADLETRWFSARAALRAAACPGCGVVGRTPARRAFFAHFLGEVGLDFGVELAPSGPVASSESEADAGPVPVEVVACWRADARGRVFRLPRPNDEREFRAQTGTCFDLRATWRQLVTEFRETGTRRETVLAEVQSGYLVGVRAGVPGDEHPERRHDPHLEHLVSRHDRRTYDTLEFLRHPATEKEPLPFVGERLDEWLGPEAAAVARGDLELFVLSDSSEFLACIEDLAAKRGIAVEWIDPDTDLKVAFHLESLRLEVQFAYPFMRAIHTARSFVGGARAFYVPLLDALEDARDIIEIVQDEVGGDGTYTADVLDGVMLRIVGAAGDEVGRWNLMTITGRLAFRGREGNQALFELLGWDTEARAFKTPTTRLDQCPLCRAPARIGKVLRPADLAGMQRAKLVGVEIGPSIVLFTQECDEHSTPVVAGPGRTIPALEAAWREGLPTSRLRLVDHRRLGVDRDQATLLVGFDAGSLVLEPERLRAALEAVQFPDLDTLDQVYAYAFFPDALVVSSAALSGKGRAAARVLALEALLPRFPARLWSLDVARPVSMEADALGHVDLAT